MNLSLPKGIEAILNTLHSNGFQAVLAGGCVRDALMGITPHDYDIATNAKPEQVMALFDHTIPTGIQHGTVTVIVDGDMAEVTTFRKEGKYSDHRHPDEVAYTDKLEDDLARRDFTINAMAWSPKDGLVDRFGGQEDLQNGIIRAVGDPQKRFAEDALRMFRAFRFAARFNFVIEEKTLQAIKDCEKLAGCIALERIVPEVEGVLQNHPEYIEQMTGLLKPWIPELEQMAKTTQNTPYHYTDVLHHTIDAMKGSHSQDLTVLWALLLHDTGKPACKTRYGGKDHFKGHELESANIARRVCHDLKLPKAMSKDIIALVKDHDTFMKPAPRSLYAWRVERGYSDQRMEQLFAVQKGDISAHAIQDRLKPLDEFIAYYEAEKEKRPFTLKELLVDGKDAQQQTALQGAQIGKVLEEVLHDVICQPKTYGTREKQLELLMRKAKPLERSQI